MVPIAAKYYKNRNIILYLWERAEVEALSTVKDSTVKDFEGSRYEEHR